MKKSQPWYARIPHPVTMIFGMIVIVTLMTYLLPAGNYERELIDGRQRVIPGTYNQVDSTPVGILDMFRALPLGFVSASQIIFVVLAGGIMFGILEKSKMIENTVGTLVKKLGENKKATVIVITTFVYGILGVAVGYENNIATVPIAAVVSLALGGDLILAAGISVGAMTIGFGLSPINPYTVGTGHKIAELPMFSGAILRSLLCFSTIAMMAYYNVRYFKKIRKDPSLSLGLGLNTDGLSLSKPLDDYTISRNNWMVLAVFLIGFTIMLFGIFNLDWFINELSAIFLMIALAAGLVARMSPNEISTQVLKSVGEAAPGAFMVGYATSIKVLMEMGNISDTISHGLSQVLSGLPTYFAGIMMSLSQCIINLFIPSGSGQALATLPVMIPLGEVLGLTRQTAVLAFQIGDGVTNLVNPTLGGLIAMLSLCRVPLDKWLRFIFPMVLIILFVSWVVLVGAVLFNYGPF